MELNPAELTLYLQLDFKAFICLKIALKSLPEEQHECVLVHSDLCYPHAEAMVISLKPVQS